MHGKGKYTWTNGKYYEGNYFNDKKHGHGIYKFLSKIYDIFFKKLN